MKEINNIALFAAFIFITVPVFISYVQKLDLGKDILLSSLRGFLQLIVMGYIISFVFSIETWYVLLLLLLTTVIIASRNAAKRGRNHSHAFWFAFTGIFIAEFVSVSLWIVFDIVQFKTQYILPMSGMIIGNSMIVAGLTFERLSHEFESSQELILVKLALGARKREACQDMIKSTIKAALIPSIDAMKTIGLVQLPGLMTGAIIAGASPITAVKYQIVIIFSLLSSAAITAITVSLLAYDLPFRRV